MPKMAGSPDPIFKEWRMPNILMPWRFRRPLAIAIGAAATTTLGGCYYGDVYGASYASGGDCAARYGNAYYDYDGYAYDDGYGYDCYDASDYGAGFVNIGFGGGWYDDYYYPGYGTWMFDSYRNRYPLRGQYLNYWGGRRAWWKHHGGRGDGQPGRPGGWNRGDRENGDGPRGDGPRGTRPGRAPGDGSTGTPPVTANPGRPDWGAGRPRPDPQQGGGAGRPRPIRNLPQTEPGDVFSAPRTGSEIRRMPRPDRAPPAAIPDRAPRPERSAPVARQPSAAPSAAPERSAPPPVRSAPETRPAQRGRANSDRLNDARPD